MNTIPRVAHVERLQSLLAGETILVWVNGPVRYPNGATATPVKPPQQYDAALSVRGGRARAYLTQETALAQMRVRGEENR